jgi:predicted DsbA family dithiol-disulfide isomerase
MADALFSADDLSARNLRRIGAGLGLDVAELDRCMTDSGTDRTIDRQAAVLREVGFEGLPTTYVGSRRIVGAQPDEVFRDALERARRGEGETGIPGAIYFACVALLAGGIVAASRRRVG